MLRNQKLDSFIRSSINKLKCQKAKMLCLSLYCLLSSGCGVKVKSNENKKDDVRRPGLETSVIRISNQDTNSSSYNFANLGDVFIPNKLYYISGDASQSIKIYFAYGDSVEELYCLYENTNVIDNDLEFVDCFTNTDYDQNGIDDPLNYQAGYSIIQTQDHTLKIETSSNSLKVLGEFEVEWH